MTPTRIHPRRGTASPGAAFLLLLLFATFSPAPAAGGQQKGTKVDFDEQSIEGEVTRPDLMYISKRGRSRFPCDITKLTLAAYNACFEKHMADLCGLQLIERERYEFDSLGNAVMQSGRAKTVGSSFPYSLQLDNGAVFLEEASEFGGWEDRKVVLQNQSPRLSAFDTFVATPTAFVLADRPTRRVFVLRREVARTGKEPFQKVELAERAHALLGVLTNQRFVAATTREVLLLGIDGKDGTRLNVPWGDYAVDPYVDRTGMMLLAAQTPNGKVYVVDAQGEVNGAFDREPGYSYHLLPNGLVASASLQNGVIKIRSRSGLVLSRAQLKAPLHQFGVWRQKGGADLFFVNDDGIGVLYGDGFEKSFLNREGRQVRVIEADNGILGVLVSTPSRDDPNRLQQRRVEFYELDRSPSRVSRLVEGICPNAIRVAEKALELKSSLKASIKDGRFNLHR